MQRKKGILLVNLGTPHSPSPSDVHRYLIQFLTDEKVIDSPWLTRQLLVRGAIVPRRYREAARQYEEIWMPEGSPLLVYGKRVKEGLQQMLGDEYLVELAMRYQNPSIKQALDLMRGEVDELLVLPLFPQYAEATTGSIIEEVERLLNKWDVKPDLRVIRQFPDDPGMIEAFAARVGEQDLSDYDHVLMSFHGLPERQLKTAHRTCLANPNCCREWGDHNRNCYAAQCYATAKVLRKRLSLATRHSTVCFQSRLGRDPWIQPFTDSIIAAVARGGVKNLLVLCPAFVCDCLETLYEVRKTYSDLFREHGGETLHLVNGLNDHPKWIEALANMCRVEVCAS